MSSQDQCLCPACRYGRCQRCIKEGCGMCPYCRRRGVRPCPYCVRNVEGYSYQEFKDSLPFDRVLLILILILVLYIAYKHYNE